MMRYVGRFAPSPSGPLHFGSLITALGSYLQAKSSQGEWLLRIEDIDPPREVKGAAYNIMHTLEQTGLYWDREVLFQSRCSERYQDVIHHLVEQKLAYFCDCNRQRIQTLPLYCYDGFCRSRNLLPTDSKPMSLRIKQSHFIDYFKDILRGEQFIDKLQAHEDFIIHRKDGLFAYNLVVVLDDHFQGVTDIVRGADLLPVTGKQISIYRLFGWAEPTYLHLPLALNANGAKLSKQNHATPIDLRHIKSLIVKALTFLGQKIPQDWQDGSTEQLINHAIAHWNINLMPKIDQIVDLH